MEKKKPEKKDSRRLFINQGIYKSVGWITGLEEIIPQESKKLRVLTPDGKVVEIEEKNIQSRYKNVNNQQILDWMDNPGLNKKSDNAKSDKNY